MLVEWRIGSHTAMLSILFIHFVQTSIGISANEYGLLLLLLLLLDAGPNLGRSSVVVVVVVVVGRGGSSSVILRGTIGRS